MPLQRARNAEIGNDYSSLIWYLCTGQAFFIICSPTGAFIVFVPVGAFSYLTENEKNVNQVPGAKQPLLRKTARKLLLHPQCDAPQTNCSDCEKSTQCSNHGKIM